MNMFKPLNAATPEEYIEKIDEPRKSELLRLHNFILKTVPRQKAYIEMGMIGYGKFHYKSKSGREGDWALIGLASQKNYISLYVCASDGKQYIAEKHRNLFPKANIGKSCIRIKGLSDINLDSLSFVLKETEKLGGFNFS